MTEVNKGCDFYESCQRRIYHESFLDDENVSEDLKEQARSQVEGYCKGTQYKKCEARQFLISQNLQC